MGYYRSSARPKVFLTFPPEATMTSEYLPLSLVHLDQEEYNRRVKRSKALAQGATTPDQPSLTPAEIKEFFQESERRLTNAILLMPSPTNNKTLNQRRQDLLNDWAFIHNETEKLLVKYPWLASRPVQVLRRLAPTEKKALEDFTQRWLSEPDNLASFDQEFRLFTKFLDSSLPHNVAALWPEVESQVWPLRVMLKDLQRQVIHWPRQPV